MFAISPTAHVPDNTTNEERWQEQTILQFWESKKREKEGGREKQTSIQINLISKQKQV